MYLGGMNMYERIYGAAIHSLVSLVALFIFARLTGKKQVSQLNFFHYVIGISIGSIAAAYAVDLDIEMPEFLTSIIIYGVFPLILAQISLKSYIGRKLLSGSPTILIQDGKIIEKNLKKTKLNINELLEECRLKNAFNLSEVEFAILEMNGQVSIQMKPLNLPVTPQDMNLPTQYKGLCANVIIDGKLLKDNLNSINKDVRWLNNELQKQNINNKTDVLLAYVDNSEQLYVYKKNENPEITPVI